MTSPQRVSSTKKFPRENFSFPGPFGACPGQKIGTIFCPKGGLAVVILIMTKLKVADKPSRVKRHDRKASLWAENCPNFFFFFCLGRPEKTSVFFWEIYPTLGYFNYGPGN
jgi:hypothetical protein